MNLFLKTLEINLSKSYLFLTTLKENLSHYGLFLTTLKTNLSTTICFSTNLGTNLLEHLIMVGNLSYSDTHTLGQSTYQLSSQNHYHMLNQSKTLSNWGILSHFIILGAI
jgi:hypothetical protein